MKTIKEFTEENGLQLSDADRFRLGKRIARMWDALKMGEKTTVKEGKFQVRTYPDEFINSNRVSKCILKFLKQQMDRN